MGKIEERKDALLPMDLILACPLNMREIKVGREAHLHKLT
jgi:hypothetical protein